ncbi:Tat pathway signal sequence domain protein [Kitasatospora sp. NPDC015120]|uniref:Tat pathway signal sequence domain protein n=1 Tax=Kitasatospora sp. NPDC015120 TaxID=3364023 RepID=UPI0036F4A195
MRLHPRLALAAAAATLAVGAVPAAAAPSAAPSTAPAAGSVLTAGGTAVAVGDVLLAPLAAGSRAVFSSDTTGSTGVFCGTSPFTAKVLANPAAPGTATASLTGLTFGSCTANVTGVTSVRSLTVGNLAYDLALASAAGHPVTLTPGPAGPIQASAVLNSWFGTLTCTYQLSGAFTGTADNTAHALVFRNAHFTKSAGSALCPAEGYFSAAYGPLTDSTRPGAPAVDIT